MRPPQQSLRVEHAAAAGPHSVLHFFCPPPGRLTQNGAAPQHPPAPAPTEHASPSHDEFGDWQTPETHERPTQHGLVALQVVPTLRQMVAPESVHTPDEHVSPLQQLPEVQAWPASRHEVVGARQTPVVQVRPAQQGVVAEHVAPVVRQTFGYSQKPDEHVRPVQHEPEVHDCLHVPHEGVGG